jgi:hypothetical protein
LGGLEKSSVTQIFYSPVLGWNNYDKVMAGLALHNIFVPEKKFEYVFMPMYSTRTNSFVGGGNISYNFYPGMKTGKEHWIRKMTLELGGQSYHYADFTRTSTDSLFTEEKTLRFSKLNSGFTFYFNHPDKSSGYSSSLSLNVIRIEKQTAQYAQCSCNRPNSFGYDIKSETKYFHEVNFRGEDNTAVNPYNFSIQFRQNVEDDLFRVAAEGNYRFSYKGRNRGFSARLFAGYVSYALGDYRLRMSGYATSEFNVYGSVQDYTFEHVFLGRSESDGILSHQFVATEGGFKTPTATGQSNSWLAAMNFKTNIPTRLPVKLFADIGWFGTRTTIPGGKSLMYDYGLELTIISNVFSIYIPVGFSQDIQDYYNAQPGEPYSNWYDRIRYEIRFEKLNPLKLVRSIQL